MHAPSRELWRSLAKFGGLRRTHNATLSNLLEIPARTPEAGRGRVVLAVFRCVRWVGQVRGQEKGDVKLNPLSNILSVVSGSASKSALHETHLLS